MTRESDCPRRDHGWRRCPVAAATGHSSVPASSRLSSFGVGAKRLDKKFTEPVALSSTRPADLPLPRRTVGLSFDLLALRARCVEEPADVDLPPRCRVNW